MCRHTSISEVTHIIIFDSFYMSFLHSSIMYTTKFYDLGGVGYIVLLRVTTVFVPTAAVWIRIRKLRLSS